MTARYVSAKKGKTTGAFDAKNAPARTLRAALGVAKPGDTIEILDAATYKEGELVIDKPLTIISSYAIANPGADPTNPLFDAKKFPELMPAKNALARVLRVMGTPSTRTSAGPVVLIGLRITGGHAVHTSSDPALGAGGGVAVIDIDNVTIERCVITGNTTEAAPFARWPEPDRLAFRNAVLDLTGEIVSVTVETMINTMINAANVVLNVAGQPPIPPFSRSVILTELAKAFDGRFPPGLPNQWLAGQAFGGGAAAVWASPTLRRCLIRGNVADGRGAGFAVVGYGWPTVDACWIDKNRSGNVGRRDGGGIGCEVALPGKLTRNLSEIDLIRFLTSKLSSAKAKIGDPLKHISVRGIIDFFLWLTDPFRPSPIVRGVQPVLMEMINQNWARALDTAVYFLATSALRLGSTPTNHTKALTSVGNLVDGFAFRITLPARCMRALLVGDTGPAAPVNTEINGALLVPFTWPAVVVATAPERSAVVSVAKPVAALIIVHATAVRDVLGPGSLRAIIHDDLVEGGELDSPTLLEIFRERARAVHRRRQRLRRRCRRREGGGTRLRCRRGCARGREGGGRRRFLALLSRIFDEHYP